MGQITTYRKHRIAVRYIFTSGIMTPTCVHLLDERQGAISGYVFDSKHRSDFALLGRDQRMEYSIMPSNWFMFSKERVLKESLDR